MTTEFYDAYIENAEGYIRSYINEAKKGIISLKNTEMMQKAFHQLSVCTLFLEADEDVYYKSMNQNISAMMAFLEQSKEADLCLSKLDIVFDIIASGYWQTLGKFQSIAPQKHNTDCEYEEDFLYRKLLVDVALEDVNIDDFSAEIDRFKDLAVGLEDTRADVLFSLAQKNVEAFLLSLSDFIDERQESIEKRISKGALEEEEWCATRYFTHEGLAFIRIAEHKGMCLGDENFLHIPQELIDADIPVYDADAWLKIPV